MKELLQNISIRGKIMALLAMMSVVALILSVQSVTALTSMKNTYAPIVESDAPATLMLVRSNRALLEVIYAGYVTTSYDAGSPQARAAAEAEPKYHERSLDLLKQAGEADPAARDMSDRMKSRFTEVHKLTSRAIQLAQRNQQAEARGTLARADAKYQEITADLSKFNDSRITEGKSISEQASQSADTNRTTLIAVSAAGIIAGLLAGFFVAQSGITSPLARLMETMNRLAQGNNAVDVPGTDRRDELGAMAKTVLVFKDNAVAKAAADADRARTEAEQKQLVDTLSTKLAALADGKLDNRIEEPLAPAYDEVKANFNSAIDSLSTLVGSVIEGANSIHTGTDEISRASEDLARRTESNAANLEETAAAIAEMEGRVKATAQAARESAQGSEAAMTAVGDGRRRTDAAVMAMGKVSESAKGIDNVIEGLDKIAFQTRVLAMNAAVEAGRAGDAGRGFAVVADLVSALAMRAEEEAKLAREKLTITQAEIASAVDAVELVDSSLAGIAAAGEQAKTLATQIADDNVAQSSAITEIAAAIASMDTATQQNAAMVEETSAAARTLKGEVESLVDQASRFDVGTGAPGARQITARAAAPGSQIRKRPERPAAAAAPRLAAPAPRQAPAEAAWKDF